MTAITTPYIDLAKLDKQDPRVKIILAEIKQRQSFRERFSADYIAKVFSTVEPGKVFKPNWHIECIAEHLNAVHDGQLKRLLITIPPRELKSIAVNVAWPTWLMGHNPGIQIMSGSYGLALAKKHSMACRYLMHAEWWRSTFPAYQFAPDEKHNVKFSSTARGHRVAVAVDGPTTGEGGDIFIIDDPIKREEAYSPTVRKTTNDWIDQTTNTRLNEPTTGAIVMIMQRFHDDDPAGHVMELGGWHHLSIPRLCQSTKTYSIGSYSHTYKQGETLNPQRIPLDSLPALKVALGSVAWTSQQQQEPIDDSTAIFPRASWRYYSALPVPLEEMDEVAQTWDMAFKAGENTAFVVGQTWARYRANKYLIDQIRDKMEFSESLRKVAEFRRKYPQTGFILIEDKANGPAIISALKDRVPGILATSPGQDSKESRARAWAPEQEAGNIYLPMVEHQPWVEDFIAEHAHCPANKYWDQIDAAGQLILRWRQAYSSLFPSDADEAIDDAINDRPAASSAITQGWY